MGLLYLYQNTHLVCRAVQVKWVFCSSKICRTEAFLHVLRNTANLNMSIALSYNHQWLYGTGGYGPNAPHSIGLGRYPVRVVAKISFITFLPHGNSGYLNVAKTEYFKILYIIDHPITGQPQRESLKINHKTINRIFTHFNWRNV